MAASVSPERAPSRARRRGLAPFVLFALACLVGLIVWAPAAWLKGALPAGYDCTELAGTIWHGECRGALRIDSFGARSDLGSLHWQLSAASLVTLSPQAELAWQQGDAKARALVRARPNGRWEIRDFQLASNYRSLTSLIDPDVRRLWQSIPLEQGLTLQIPLATFTAKEIHHLQAELQFSAYGEHTLVVSPDGSGALRSGKGVLQIEGPLAWQRDGRYRLELKIRLADETEPALRKALASLGPIDPRGEYDLTIEGSVWSLTL